MTGRIELRGPLMGLLIPFVSASCGVELVSAPDEYLPWPDLNGSWTVELNDGWLPEVENSAGASCEIRGLELSLSQAPASTGPGERTARVQGEHSGAELVCRGVGDRLPLPAPFGADTILVIAPGTLDGEVSDWCPSDGPIADPVGGCIGPWVPRADLRLVDVAPPSDEGLHYHLFLSSDEAEEGGMDGLAQLRWVEPGVEPVGPSTIVQAAWQAVR